MNDLFENAKEVTISAEIGGVFSTDAEYENERHKIGLSLTFNNGLEKIDIDKKRKQIEELLRNELADRERKSHQKYLQNMRKDIRWSTIDGEIYPHVTSILETISPTDFHMDSDKLDAYAARGQVLDFVLQKFIETGEWVEPKDHPEVYKYLKQMKIHKLEMSGNLSAFIEKYKPVFKEGHKKVINKTYKYVGSPDIAYGFLDDVPTLFDLKNRTSIAKMEKVKIFKQMAAYARAENIGNEIEQLCMIIINDSTKQGFSAPVTTTNIDKYFDLFLADLYEFKQKFNLED